MMKTDALLAKGFRSGSQNLIRKTRNVPPKSFKASSRVLLTHLTLYNTPSETTSKTLN